MALPPLSLVKLQGLNTAYTIATKDGKPDPNFIIQFQTLIDNLTQQINAIVVAFNTAETAQGTADSAQASADNAQTTANGAQAGVDTLAADQYLIAAASPDLANARVATPTATVTFDFGTAGQFKVDVDALAILNLAAVVLTQNLSTTGTLHADGAATLGAGLTVTGQTETGSLDIDTTVTVATTAQVGYVTINIGGIPTKFLTG